MGEAAVRVAHVVHGLMMGGLEQVVVRLCDAGRAFGIEPRVIAFGADGSMRDLLEEKDIPVTWLGRVAGMSPAAIRGIGQALRSHRVDVVHAHDLGPWFNALCARALYPRARTAVTFHQVHTPEGLARAAAVGAALLTDALVACGNEVHTCVNAWAPAPSRLELIGNGVPVGPPPTAEDRRAARALLGVPEEARVVGYLGRLHDEKGVDLLVDAFCEALGDEEDTHLVLIGRGDLEEDLRLRAGALCGRRVHFPGEIVNASSLLPGLDVYVQPSRREGRSLSMLEAMAAGLPTVAQALPAIREIHRDGETALLVPVAARPAFGPALKRLLQDAPLRTRMGQRAREHVRAFSVDAMARRYAALYQGLVGGAVALGGAS